MWQPDLYLQYAEQRTQPAIDLAARVDAKDPRAILDLGCGPGNSTEVLAHKWPGAAVSGLDNSPAMLRQAAIRLPKVKFIQRDASEDLSDLGCFDIIFSNAALQWLPRHSPLIHRLFAMLNPNGVLAVQIPHTGNMPAQRILRQMADSARWQGCLAGIQGHHIRHTLPYYYDILSSLPGQSQLWQTTYLHVMDDHAQLVSWFSATTLLPYLAALGELKEKFLEEYEYNLRQAYHRQADGKILFPFERLFFIVRKSDKT